MGRRACSFLTAPLHQGDEALVVPGRPRSPWCRGAVRNEQARRFHPCRFRIGMPCSLLAGDAPMPFTRKKWDLSFNSKEPTENLLMEFSGSCDNNRISIGQVLDWLERLALLVAHDASGFKHNAERSKERFARDDLADIDIGIIGATGDVDAIDGGASGAPYTPKTGFLQQKGAQSLVILSIQIETDQAVFNMVNVTDLTTATITKCSIALCRLVDSSTEEFTHECPLNIFWQNGSLNRQNRQRDRRRHAAKQHTL